MRDLSKVSDALSVMLTSISESFTLVSELGPPNVGESPTDIHTRLLVTRSVMSNVSETVAKLIRVRGMVRQEQIERKGELEDAESKAMVELSKPSFVEEYSTAKERNAKLGAKTLSERISVREADAKFADVDSAYEYARNRLWELDRSVRDIETRIRIMSFEPGDF
jgi:hypothetical protein